MLCSNLTFTAEKLEREQAKRLKELAIEEEAASKAMANVTITEPPAASLEMDHTSDVKPRFESTTDQAALKNKKQLEKEHATEEELGQVIKEVFGVDDTEDAKEKANEPTDGGAAGDDDGTSSYWDLVAKSETFQYIRQSFSSFMGP